MFRSLSIAHLSKDSKCIYTIPILLRSLASRAPGLKTTIPTLYFADNLDIDLKLHEIPVRDDAKSLLGLMQMKKRGLDCSKAPVVYLHHGAMSNGLIFWSLNGKGLGPYLAGRGVNVFIGDLRGRGFSVPTIQELVENKCKVAHGQLESIRDDLPTLSEAVSQLSGRLDGKQTWIAHSWGGVLLTAAMARSGPNGLAERVDSFICLGTKKFIGEKRSWAYFKNITFGWNILSPLLAKYHGYLPSKVLKFGMDDETESSLADCTQWIQTKDTMIDPTDGFDYLRAWKALPRKPPTWHISAVLDPYLGNPKDVKRWADFTSQTQHFTILSKKNGNMEDYNHNSMLTSRMAVQDHFPQIFDWIKQHER